MSTATLPSVIEDIDIQDLFDLDIQIERTETIAEDSFTSIGCPSLVCWSYLPTGCCA
ncbi:hypothetical protein ACFZB9_35710 [Kitasatospora sp. NPDC008050]|uniref:hypothetical protein n=1 Tax=Kitasatospora sp. NPDC008050 TaxID=3364021 RepID=UPI0036E7ECAC